MRFNAVIELVAPGACTQDAIGQQVSGEPTRRTIHANEFSLSTREVYEAGQQGLKPERQYQVRALDYADEPLAVVDGVTYDVLATRHGEWTRLTLTRTVSGG